MKDMSPIDWALRPLKHYADFSGRAPRAEYWWYTLAVIVVTVIVSFLEAALGLSGLVGPYGPLSVLLGLGLLLPGLAVSVRRLHDTDRSGWWLLLVIVPYFIFMLLVGGAMASGSMAALGGAGLLGGLAVLVCAIVLLVFYVQRGTAGSNRFGPDPYGADVGEVFS